MSGFRFNLPRMAAALTIDDWGVALRECPAVVHVEPALGKDGRTKKSEVPAAVLLRGGGRFCPYELHVHVGP